MRAPSHAYRGFTLIELIATITIVAILAAVALPSVIAANPFADRGYADVLAANLRRARAVALATGCDVAFVVDDTGYRAAQRAPLGTHCSTVGAFPTMVFSGPEPSEVILGGMQQVIFSGADGRLVGAPVVIGIGTRQITVDPAGLVTGP
jgi:prepilin-type N-terminal cleavage/methylation domain-containing protein